MSFRCESCHVAQPAGTRPIVRVVQTRDRIYNVHAGDAYGSEIVQEQKVCPSCDGKASDTTIARALNATTLTA
jgi:hypothetical protein